MAKDSLSVEMFFDKNVKERPNPREWLIQSLMVPNDDSSPRVTASVSTSSFAEFSMYKLLETGLRFDDSPPQGFESDNQIKWDR